ncbi:MAG: 2-C-methyl-D-erythritol 2,4-cyclodiphosphate synthase [Verrucomicrobia bacterium]|nr:2-C-methyl-D-erythritol 2,4-cyclodiphosphate synthase [Verrucomicrobiota bacterium]
MSIIRTGFGRASRRFLSPESTKTCVIGGVVFEDLPGLAADSDGDVIYHALCSAIASLTGVQVLVEMARELLCKDGITNSGNYLKAAMQVLGSQKVQHVSLQLEGKRPLFYPCYDQIRNNVAEAMGLLVAQVGITATSGEGLTDFGCGDGVLCHAIVTTQEVL